MSPGQQRVDVCAFIRKRCEVPDLCSEGVVRQVGPGPTSKADEGPHPEDSLLLGAPGDVVWPRGCMILIDELLHNLPGRVQLVKVLLEDVLLAELLQEGLPLPQLVILATGPLEELGVCRKQRSQRTSRNNMAQRAREPRLGYLHSKKARSRGSRGAER